MSWLILTLFCVLTTTADIYTNNYISDCYFKDKQAASVRKFSIPASFIMGTIFLIVGAIVFPDSFNAVTWQTPLLIFIANIFVAISGVAYYKALELDDSTNVGIFMQISPILYLIFGWLMLGETISGQQLIAFSAILCAPLLIVLSTKKPSKKRMQVKSAMYTFIYVLVVVIASLLYVQQANNTGINFISSLGFAYFGKGVGNAIIMAVRPKWRKRYKTVLKKSNKKLYRPLFFLVINSTINNLSQYAALLLAPSVAFVSVVGDAVTPVSVFLIGIILTMIWPKFGREKLTFRSIVAHLAATVLVVVGILLLQ